MTATLLSAPATEPLSLAEAKAFLRVEHAEEDALIGSLIAAGREQVEMRTRLRLVTQTWRLHLGRWPPDGRVVVPFGPLREVTAARLRDRDGGQTPLDADAFVIDRLAAKPCVAFMPGTVTDPEPAQTIELDVEVGYGAASDVPAPLRHAVRAFVVHAYERRGGFSDGTPRIPEAFAALIAPYRSLSL